MKNPNPSRNFWTPARIQTAHHSMTRFAQIVEHELTRPHVCFFKRKNELHGNISLLSTSFCTFHLRYRSAWGNWLIHLDRALLYQAVILPLLWHRWSSKMETTCEVKMTVGALPRVKVMIVPSKDVSMFYEPRMNHCSFLFGLRSKRGEALATWGWNTSYHSSW